MKSFLLTLLLAMPAAAQPALQYLVLGDSTAAGEGGRYEEGIAVLTAARLGEGRKVTMTNLAVSGAQVRDVLVEQLPRVKDLRPDLVLLSVGANDVTHLTPVRSMRRDLRAVIAQLRERNPEVAIVITGSPDMGSPPRIPRLLRGLASCRTKQVNRMFVAEAAALGLTFAPIAEVTGPMFRQDRSLFAADRFHPNERGYATWVPVLNAALAKALPLP
ncbi:MAG TPA: SGNH/GDSL hydrolase family protein [Thermoanaerobaculia bacterium]|nr:SGNH/GDSL hydrolase family protein [Thermoanaerobaculia bacterium]